MSSFETHRGLTWTAPDIWASEKETGDFLYGLVRLLKPKLAIETGCYRGDSSERIADALRVNGFGHLITCDTNPEMCDATKRRLAGLPASVWQSTGEKLAESSANVDFAFLDSSGDRVAEALALKMSPHGIIVLHDARRDTLPQIIEKTGWQKIFIDTPRGLAIIGSNCSLT